MFGWVNGDAVAPDDFVAVAAFCCTSEWEDMKNKRECTPFIFIMNLIRVSGGNHDVVIFSLHSSGPSESFR